MDEDGIEEKAEEGGIQKLKMRTQKGLSKKKKLKERNNEFADEGKKQQNHINIHRQFTTEFVTSY